MRLIRRAAFGLFVLVCHPATSWAQAPQRPVEVAATIGFGSFLNGVSKAESAREVAGIVAWRPFTGAARRLGFELRAARMTQNEAVGPLHYNRLDASLASAHAVLHFRPDSRTQPYLLAGIGIITANASRRCADCSYTVDPAGTRTYIDSGETEHGKDMARVFGAGFKSAVARHVSIRGEFLFARALQASYEAARLDSSPNLNKGPWGWDSFSIGVGLRF